MIREYTNREVAKIIEDAEETEIRLVPRLMLKKRFCQSGIQTGSGSFLYYKGPDGLC